MKYGIDSLISLVDSEKLPVWLNKDIQLVLDSINDWPQTIGSLDIFVEVLSKSIGQRLTHINIEKYMLALDPKTDAWRMEALTHLLCLFSGYPNEVTLGEILLKIENEIESALRKTFLL